MSAGLLFVVAVAVVVVGVLALKLRARQRDLDAAVGTLTRQAALARLGMLMAGIAHELSTPVGAISCSLDTRRRALARIREEVDALLAIEATDDAGTRVARIGKTLDLLEGTDAVLDAALDRTASIVRHMRLSGRGEKEALEVVALDDVVAGATVLLNNMLKQGIELRVDGDPEAKVRAHPAALASIVINLLVNARQAVGGEGTITLTTRRADGRVILDVADDGPGFPAAECERIFSPGYTTKSADEGTGLGLYISRRIAADHGGTLTAGRGNDGGAVFQLDLPAATATGASGE